MWVVECFSYPKPVADQPDRVVIFEDRDGDGRFDSRKVFWDKGTGVTGIELGFGGVWLTATPNLLFIPDHDGDDVPDGEPIVELDGWDPNGKHNIFNGLAWGPDGWLYGCNGILSNSKPAKPGTPVEQRPDFNCGVWRFHPTRKSFEVVATGTTNPWGLDFDDQGQMFITNCVINHLFHIVPGGHYQRMFGQDFNQHWYSLMTSCADYLHWAGGPWQESRGNQPKHSDAGGGHAHSGAMIYLGDNWPDAYRNMVFTCNIHGARLNSDFLDRKGSGIASRRGKDLFMVDDPWFRGVAVKQGPDGGVFVADWTDTGECHDYDEVDRTNGRIFKVTHGKPEQLKVDLAKASDDQLVQLQLHKNDWLVRHARRVLQERAAAGKLNSATQPALLKILRGNADVSRQLRALWALHAIGKLDEPLVLELLGHRQAIVRGWAIQLELEDNQLSPSVAAKLLELAKSDSSPVVRLYLASGLQRLAITDRWPLAEALVAHEEDAADQNLPLMLWYAVEPLTAADKDRAVKLVTKTKIPLVRQYLVRRIAANK
jgi:putative membrane-bound dehydrogenase-like protein